MRILAEGDAGLPVAQILRKHGDSQATSYKWKTNYGGTSMPEFCPVKELELENLRLRRTYAGLAFENPAIKAVFGRRL